MFYRKRLYLAVGLAYQIDRVSLAVGLSFCLHKPCKCFRQGYPIKWVKFFAFSECQINKDGYNTDTKHVNELDIASYS